jgi:hypothetical protein
MADVIITYSRQDAELTQKLAADLEARGYSVWWDTHLQLPGAYFRETPSDEVTAAKAVIVIWTPSSVKSNWILDEALAAVRGGKLLVSLRLPTMGHNDIPPGFRMIHSDVVGDVEALVKSLTRQGVTPSAGAASRGPGNAKDAKVFISYRRSDGKYQAHRIHQAFCQAISGKRMFMDIDNIQPGENFPKVLTDWVDQCGVLLALIGPGWIDAKDPKTGKLRLENPNDFVRIEIGQALKRRISVVPVLLDGAPMPVSEQLPDNLKDLVDRQAAFVDFRTFDDDVKRLIRKLKLVDGSI